jgi:alpha-L-fucosidase
LGNNSNDFNESDIWGFEYPYFKDKNPKKALPQKGNTAPSEVCDKIGPGWFWNTKEKNENLKSAEEIAEMLNLSNNRSANYLLNIAPDNTGLIPEHTV